jgi:hypothetical protein
MAKTKTEKVKTTTTYEVVVTGGPEKRKKLNGVLLSIHLKPFKDVTVHSVTDKDGKETIEKVVIVSDKRKKVRNLFAALYNKYNVTVTVIDVVTKKEEPKK